MIYLFFSLPKDKRTEQKRIFRIGIGFLLLGIAAGINLKLLPLFEHTYAYMIHDWLELWAAIYICYGITNSLVLLTFTGVWALMIQVFLNMAPLIFIPHWQSSPFPLGGGDYPYEALEEMVGELPLFALAAMLFFNSYMRRKKSTAKLFILLGLASLALVRIAVFTKSIPTLPKHNFLWATGHVFKIISLVMFLISFYFMYREKQHRVLLENSNPPV